MSAQAHYIKVLIVSIGPHTFGARIDNIQDVIQRNPTTRVPLVPANIIGLLNLRGHIVTEINVAATLDIDEDFHVPEGKGYSVVINKDNEMYSMVFEGVGDVIDIPLSDIEKLPDTINRSWMEMASGVYRLNEKLVVLLDFNLLINHLTPELEHV